MATKISENKIKKFFDMVVGMASKSPSFCLAMIIAKKDTGADVVQMSGMSNSITFLRANKTGDEVEVVVELAKAVQDGRMVFLEISDYLHPNIYNAIHLLSSAGRIEYNTLKERAVVHPVSGASLVLFANENSLNKLNYDYLLNFVGLIERI